MKLDGGRLIIFEGLDGVGKSTQLKRAAEALRDQGYDVVTSRNLGGTPIGEALREVMFSPLERPGNTDLYISVAIQEALAEYLAAQRSDNKVILLDRSPLSLAAYELYGSGADAETVWHYVDKGMQAFKPDLTLLYESDIETALERARQQSGKADYFESKPLDFFTRAKQGYDEVAKRYPLTRIDASGSIDEVHAKTISSIRHLFA